MTLNPTSDIGHWLHHSTVDHVYNLMTFQNPDAYDIMSCTPASDTCIDNTNFPPSQGATVASSAHRTNNGPESFLRNFSAQFTSPHPAFFIFGDALVKQTVA